mmetsp:Transcript_14965/g.34564  ORF Transcript_14965/g.34564 Transcript_14965/m.34564 type:complete len:103 (-) Transcript_14965:93-401(-)
MTCQNWKTAEAFCKELVANGQAHMPHRNDFVDSKRATVNSSYGIPSGDKPLAETMSNQQSINQSINQSREYRYLCRTIVKVRLLLGGFQLRYRTNSLSVLGM